MWKSLISNTGQLSEGYLKLHPPVVTSDLHPWEGFSHRMCYQTMGGPLKKDTVDGRNPARQPPGMFLKPVVNNGR